MLSISRFLHFFLSLGFFVAGSLSLVALSQADEILDLSPRIAAGDLARVSVELKAGGSLLVRAEQTESNAELAEPSSLPMEVTANLTYEELRLPVRAEPSIWAARHYSQADASIKVENAGKQPMLPADCGLVLVQVEPSGRTFFATSQGPLQRNEFDLIHTVGNSLLLNRLLPTESVSSSESWTHDTDTMAGLLALDSVSVCEVSSIIEKISSRYVQLRLAGTVHGVVDGAATELELKGIYRFNKRLRRITHCNLAVKEKRSLGGATPGLEVVAKLKIVVAPLAHSKHLSKDRVASLARIEPEMLESIVFHSPQKGVRIIHDHGWYVTNEEREAVTLRRIGDNDLIGHCTLRRLPSKSIEHQTLLEAFQKDVRFGLRDSFEEFARSRQWTNKHGCTCLTVVARGHVEEVPVEWHHYLVMTESGQRASLAFTVQGSDVERFANADQQLVESLELFEPVELTEQVAKTEPEIGLIETKESATRIVNKSRRRRHRTARRGRPGRR